MSWIESGPPVKGRTGPQRGRREVEWGHPWRWWGGGWRKMELFCLCLSVESGSKNGGLRLPPPCLPFHQGVHGLGGMVRAGYVAESARSLRKVVRSGEKPVGQQQCL